MEKLIYLISFIFLLSFVTSAPTKDDENLITREIKFQIPDNIEEFKFEIEKEAKNGRIINGNPAHNSQFPFVGDVSVRWRDGRTTYCTACLLAPDWVITSRTCIVNDLLGEVGSLIMLAFGSASRTGGRTETFAAWATWKDNLVGEPHPDFTLIRLGTNLPISSTIAPVQLPRRDQIDERFQMSRVVIAGWGNLDVAGTRATTLQWADYVNTTPFECVSDLVIGATRYHFCSTPINPNTNLHSGDFGGPVLLYENGPAMPPTLIGIVSSTGLSVTTFTDFALNTQLGQFMEFIIEVTSIPWRI